MDRGYRVIFCSSYLLTAFLQSPRLPYPLNRVAVCDKPVSVINQSNSPSSTPWSRQHQSPPTATSGHQRQAGSLSQDKPPESQPLQSTDSHAQAPALAAATQERRQRPQSDPNMVRSMHKPVGVISLYSQPSVPWSRHWHKSLPTTTISPGSGSLSHIELPSEPSNPLTATCRLQRQQQPPRNNDKSISLITVLFQQQSGTPSTKDAPPPWELTVISTVLLHPYLVFVGLRCTACLSASFASLQSTRRLSKWQILNDCCTVPATIRYITSRGCPLKVTWFQPSISLYSPDTRGSTTTKPNPRTGPITPHSRRSDPKVRCTDPAVIRFATSKRLPPKNYPARVGTGSVKLTRDPTRPGWEWPGDPD